MKSSVGLVGWPAADGLSTSGHPLAVGRGSSAEPGKLVSTAVPRKVMNAALYGHWLYGQRQYCSRRGSFWSCVIVMTRCVNIQVLAYHEEIVIQLPAVSSLCNDPRQVHVPLSPWTVPQINHPCFILMYVTQQNEFKTMYLWIWITWLMSNCRIYNPTSLSKGGRLLV